LFRDVDNISPEFHLDKEFEYVEEVQPAEAQLDDLLVRLVLQLQHLQNIHILLHIVAWLKEKKQQSQHDPRAVCLN